MPSAIDDDWSDSDEEILSEVETSVLLGLPDGPIVSPADIFDAAVSRVGGLPAFLPSCEPSFSSSQCKVCSRPMELLVQMWCPFENSPMDRALYIWGCSRAGCQSKDGSVRAWRGLRFNEKYAQKLQAKLAKQKEKDAARALEKQEKQTPKLNPFSMAGTSAPNPFGLGAKIFDGTSNVSAPVMEDPSPHKSVESEQRLIDDPSDDESVTSSSSDKSLLTAFAATTLDESPWKVAPSYHPLYLSTASEYLPPQPKVKLPAGVQVTDPADARGKKEKDISWAMEPYENSLEVDQAFENFAKRVSYEGEQCVRYELHGTPLPFASDKVFERLFPVPPSDPLPVTKPDFKVIHAQKRSYDASSVAPCPYCKSKRVFECQLMPNLINVLKRDTETKEALGDGERKKALEAAIKSVDVNAQKGMEWGTCMIFSCEKDCRVAEGGVEEKEVWREEFVLVQWDV